LMEPGSSSPLSQEPTLFLILSNVNTFHTIQCYFYEIYFSGISEHFTELESSSLRSQD
jgi:hypothetical protein